MKSRFRASLGMTLFCDGRDVVCQSSQKSRTPRQAAGATEALPSHEAFGEGVVAGADAHRVVPGDGEGPPS
jgi:hypothetical protein